MKTTTIQGSPPTKKLRTILLAAALLGGMWMTSAPQQAEARQYVWEQTGGPEIGFVQALHRHSDGTMIAAGGNGGVFFSTDDGQSWQRSNIEGVKHGVQAFVSMPSGNIVAGAGEQGTYRSTDNGRSFQKVGLDTVDISALMVAEDGALFLGTTGTNGGQIIRSTDEGETGVVVASFGSDISVRGIADSEGVYAAALAGSGGGIAVSTNSGINWSTQSLSGQPEGMAVAVDGSGTFYVAVNDWSTGTEGELYRSTDGGASWDILDPTPNDQGWVQDVMVDGSSILVVSDLEMLTVSTDGGDSFVRPSADFYAGANNLARTSGGDLIMSAEPRGLYRSTDDGTTWQPSVDGFVDSYVQDLTRAPGGAFYAVAGGVLFRSETGMGDWSDPLPNDDVLTVAVHPSGTVYTGGNFSGGIRRSTDGGDTWTTLSDPLLADFLVTTALEAVPGGEVFAAGFNFQNGNKGFVRSTDDGASWESINVDLGDSEIAVIRERQNGDLFMATRYPASLYRSTNRGQTWNEIGIPDLEYLNDVVFHPDGTIFIAGQLGAHRSSDGGSSWTLASEGLPAFEDPFFGDEPPFLRAAAITSRGELFGSGADGQIYRSLDKGSNWTPLTEGPLSAEGVSIPVLAIYDGRLYAGTAGGGVARTTGSVVSVEQIAGELPEQVFVSRNYPNPFTSQTTLEFGLEDAGAVSLRVYDTLGREVATLADGTLQAGMHRVTFDGAGLPAGTYIYRLSTPSGAASRTMTLLK